MSTDTESRERTRSDLVRGESTTVEYLGGSFAVLGTVVALLGVWLLDGQTGLQTPVAGTDVGTLVGVGSVVLAVGLFVLGSLSRTDALETTPGRTGGAGVAAGFALLWFVVGSLVGAQTLGLSTLWPVLGVFAAAFGAAASLVPREDVGTTLQPALIALLAGVVVLSGAIDASWTWQPGGLAATFTADLAVALVAVTAGMLGAWTGARAYRGFGARGRQASAYMLVSANAAAMVVLLGVIVTFVAVNGWSTMTRGIKYGLFWGPVWWTHVPVADTWVIVKGPILWFYWPFAMNGYALFNDINGIAPAIIGTVWLVAGAVVFALPLGVGAAVFLTEYAERGPFTRVVEVATDGLWSTPSIVYGLFGLAFLVPRLGDGKSILAGQLVLGFMFLPLVVITSREALNNVPDEYRDASAALGVSKWQTIKSVVLPAAMPGVITGAILGVGRIAGETAPILLVTGGGVFPSRGPDVLGGFEVTTWVGTQFPFVYVNVSNDVLLEASSALPYQLYAIITAGLQGNNLDFAWGTALVLLLVVLSFYAVGIASRVYFRKKLQA
ncbi:MAG: phosphate ABC transporter permease PstA [Halobacterium sp.]